MGPFRGVSAGVTRAAAFHRQLSWGTVVHLCATSLQQNSDFPTAAPKGRFLEGKSRNARPLKGHTQNSVPFSAVLLVKEVTGPAQIQEEGSRFQFSMGEAACPFGEGRN